MGGQGVLPFTLQSRLPTLFSWLPFLRPFSLQNIKHCGIISDYFSKIPTFQNSHPPHSSPASRAPYSPGFPHPCPLPQLVQNHLLKNFATFHCCLQVIGIELFSNNEPFCKKGKIIRKKARILMFLPWFEIFLEI